MIITNDKKLKAIQKEFHTKFPYLKMEFYSGEHKAGQGSPLESRIDPEKTLGEVRAVINEGDFRIDANMTVSDLEKGFFEKYGLNAQVFRRSGNLWMQTTSTDHWSLQEQNRKGGASVQHLAEKIAREEAL